MIKTAAEDSLVVGDVQTFTITLENHGHIDATNVVLTDTIEHLINNSVGATGAGYIGHMVSAGDATGVECSSASVSSTARELTCTVEILPPCLDGVCPQIEVQVRPGGNGGSRTNTVEAFSQDVADPDLSNNQDSATFDVTPRVDVIVDKVGSPAPAIAGQNHTYVITATNVANGLSEAENVTITDTLPSDVTFVSAVPASGTCSATPTPGETTVAGDEVICNLGTIANGAQRTVTIVVRPNTVTRGETLTNAVAVTTSTPETDTTNNTAEVDILVQVPVLDIAVGKSDTIDPVAVGDDTVYNITVNNFGPSVAENVTITDTLPTTRLSYQSHTISGGGNCSREPEVGTIGGTLECTWPVMEAGESREVRITMRGVAKGATTNVVRVTSDEIEFDTNAGNNVASETTTVRTRADMEVVSKLANTDPVNLRDNFNFTIRVRNNSGDGLAEADEVFVTDTLPAGMVLTGTPSVAEVAGSTTSAICTGASGGTSLSCNLGTVSSGAIVDITVPVRVIAVTSNPESVENTASVTTSSLDTNPSNDTNTGTVVVNSSSITGQIFRDFDDDGVIDPDDTGIFRNLGHADGDGGS